MEHTCHQCRALVPDGVAFCANCGAPQIRVASSDDPPASPPLLPDTPAEVQPPAQPVAPAGATSDLDWGKAFPVVAVAGLGVALLASVPIVALGCCLWALAGGAAAVALYRRRATVEGPAGPEMPFLSTGAGLKLGAATGMFASLFYLAVLFGLGSQRDLRSNFRRAISDAASRNSDPNAQPLFDWLGTPEGLAAFLALSIALLLAVLVIFSIAGGAIGASLSRPKSQVPPPRP